MKRIRLLFIVAAVTVSLTACGPSAKIEKEKDSSDIDLDIDIPDSGDIDIDKLNEAAENIGNLDLGTDSDTDSSSSDTELNGDVTHYSYTDVTRNGDELTVVPNGGMSGSTVLYGDKDLEGFLDYVDSDVLETGRNINRDLFYDLFAIMIVDKDLSPDFEQNEKNMMMALAVANNFYDTDVKINKCILDANNASEYNYDVTAYGKDDTWIVDYGKRTFYMNNGATEYSSSMFEDQNLAVWLVAIEEYYGIS